MPSVRTLSLRSSLQALAQSDHGPLSGRSVVLVSKIVCQASHSTCDYRCPALRSQELHVAGVPHRIEVIPEAVVGGAVAGAVEEKPVIWILLHFAIVIRINGLSLFRVPHSHLSAPLMSHHSSICIKRGVWRSNLAFLEHWVPLNQALRNSVSSSFQKLLSTMLLKALAVTSLPRPLRMIYVAEISIPAIFYASFLPLPT